MIKIEVDEAYAYDMLSILEVKHAKVNNEENYKNYFTLFEQINRQIGRHEEIVFSEEYLKLCLVNEKIFERINEIKGREAHAADAVYIDDMNYQRYLAKKNLQEKFFPLQKLSEQKIGYEK